MLDGMTFVSPRSKEDYLNELETASEKLKMIVPAQAVGKPICQKQIKWMGQSNSMDATRTNTQKAEALVRI